MKEWIFGLSGLLGGVGISGWWLFKQRSRQKFLRNIYDHIPFFIALLNKDGHIEYVNDLGAKSLGYTSDYLRHSDYACLHVNQDEAARFLENCLKYPHAPHVRESTLKAKFGLIEVREDVVVLNNGEIVLLVTAVDISETKKLEERMQWSTLHDPLTKLYNRPFIHSKIEEAISNKEEGHLLLLDIDHFKAINSTCGHTAGDAVLQMVAKIICETVREDDLVGRVSGDSFKIVLRHCQEKAALRIAQSILNYVADVPLDWGDSQYPLSVSIGLSPFLENTEMTVTAVQQALSLAKKKGGNKIEINKTPIATAKLPLYKALSNEIKIQPDNIGVNFVLFSQKIQNLKNNEVHHEVLIRLQIENQIISPSQFLPILESTYKMVILDRLIVEKTFQILMKNPDLSLAVNLSGNSLNDETFIQFILNCHNQYPINAKNLMFEITESEAIQNLKSTATVLKVLKGLHHQIALDDFGQSYSSFAYLHELPFDVLKIDGQFIQTLDRKESRAIVIAIQSLASSLDKQTVAEFVSHESVLKQCQDLNIDWGQGYAIEHPQPLISNTATPKPA